MRIVGYALFRPPVQIMNGLLSIRTLGPSYRGAPHLTVASDCRTLATGGETAAPTPTERSDTTRLRRKAKRKNAWNRGENRRAFLHVVDGSEDTRSACTAAA